MINKYSWFKLCFFLVLLSPTVACKLTLDPNTAHSRLSLSPDNRKATVVRNKLPYPEHPERFHHWKQVLCKEGLMGRCYWVVAWEGWVNIGVTYKGIKRKGQDDDCWIGQNDKSWSLLTCGRFTACHKNERIVIPVHSSVDSGRVAVYLDWPAGTLTFYSLSSDTLSHLHTFRCKFTQPLYPAFGIESNSKSSVCL